MSDKKGLRRVLTGTVTSDKMDNTVVVTVIRRFRHPIYGKFVQRRKKYMAHDAGNQCKIGDRVAIEESRPMSKRKRWVVQKILERAM
ncbi:30S ribosomal protein S17 [Dissulfuribacter thermophilus]|uniref:30S ribosomal protein S17 n=1 Tax=Dissulfuribacter thermophilus TaxID=1156395 RepID=UPI00082C185C|nr:30S ribosomal protein S17 [Dissulfuribacter thermophilus]